MEDGRMKVEPEVRVRFWLGNGIETLITGMRLQESFLSLIPNVKDQVILGDIMTDKEKEKNMFLDYDYYIVTKKTYWYTSDTVLIDLVVEGRYYDNN